MDAMRDELADGRPRHMITIGQLAGYAGVTIKAVRHYHERGLLGEPERDASGYRRYSADHAIELVKIKTLADAGVPLARIGELLTAGDERFAEAITDPEFCAINLAYDAAFDWSPDDIRLPALADRSRRWLTGRRPGGAGPGPAPDPTLVRLAATSAARTHRPGSGSPN